MGCSLVDEFLLFRHMHLAFCDGCHGPPYPWMPCGRRFAHNGVASCSKMSQVICVGAKRPAGKCSARAPLLLHCKMCLMVCDHPITSINLGGKALVAASSTELIVTTYLIQWRIPESVLALVFGQLPKIAAKSACDDQSFLSSGFCSKFLLHASMHKCLSTLDKTSHPKLSSACVGLSPLTSSMTLGAFSILCTAFPAGPLSRIRLFCAASPT